MLSTVSFINVFGQIDSAATTAHNVQYSQKETLLAQTSYSDYYLMNTGIKPIGNYVEMWVKEKPQKGKIAILRKSEIESRKRYKLPVAGYDKYAYCVQKFKFNCNSDEFIILKSIDYDTEGDEIGESHKGEWDIIVPETIVSELHKFACQFKDWDNK